ncbi:hypothetical protein ACD578_15880 [Microvirga sp. RSM25]|uniref:hypothetical protein n=1 Tax=Microvirga sp. RSM25 TaxID=3273802 RepID=UPI00384C6114
MRQSTIARLQKIEKRRNLNGPLQYMSDDDLLAVLQQSIRESGGAEASATEARADRDEATALIIEMSEGCRSGADLMARLDQLNQGKSLAVSPGSKAVTMD